MHQDIQKRYLKYITETRRRNVLKKVVNVLACAVIFCTTYALILPAITMEQEAFCGLQEHSHTEKCYRTGDRGALICIEPTVAGHIHGENCYMLPEKREHVHSESCLEQVRGELVCTTDEYEGHTHDSSCYQVSDVLVCTLPLDHVHGDDCYTYPLSCSLSTEPHVHGEACFVRGGLCCSTIEGHVHCEGCTERILSCMNEEEGHEHTDGCYTVRTVCETPVNHNHDAVCYESVSICGIEAGTVHTHDLGCYNAESVLSCTLPENHAHEYTCFERELLCTTPEKSGHSHSEDCYQWENRYTCGYEAGDMEQPAPELTCTEPSVESHIHSDSCYEVVLPICGITDPEHIHTSQCGPVICGLEEHSHILACYSNPEADVESQETWEATFYEIELTGNWNEDVVAIAESQLGYTESARNYAVWEDNTVHGYTRYGAWYGVPYGDWCGMFASFCLHYAGVEEMPLNYGVRPWIEDLTELDLYHKAEDYIPNPGDLVFFDWEGDELSDHVGIVAGILPAEDGMKPQVKTIEGNSSNCVQYVYYDLDDEQLLGYSQLPLNMEWFVCGQREHIHGDFCYDAENNQICGQDAHTHSDSCSEWTEILYCCGLEAHTHNDDCRDAEDALNCELPEHQHTVLCNSETVFYCNMEQHLHDDSCRDDQENIFCQLQEHIHKPDCTFPPLYYCSTEEHSHSKFCRNAEDGLFCGLTEHTHSEDCTRQTVYLCEVSAHTHEGSCYNEEGFLLCKLDEHTHVERCMTVAQCFCGITDHTHTIICTADLRALNEADREVVEAVILLIHEMPSADEIDAKIEEFEEAEDYEGEELWLTEVYQQVAQVNASYCELGEDLQGYVVNREKLLELEYIWSVVPLANYYVWLDGTNGGLMAFTGSDDKKFTQGNRSSFSTGTSITLPETWKSPAKYHYELNGWYDITTGMYYAPGDTLTIGNSNHVLYADWMAGTYDVGFRNEHTVNSLDTSDFITTHVFDYSSIFNMYSTTYTGTSDNYSHSETWDAVRFQENNTPVNGERTLGFIFRDWDRGDSDLSYPKDANLDWNQSSTGSESVTKDILSRSEGQTVLNYLFAPSNTQNILGKKYVGQGNYLYQFMEEGSYNYDGKHNGYYYYDSTKNAASYNQSEGRFYIYNYLERTSDSLKDGVPNNTLGAYSDFLPFNSPYANTNGKAIHTYSANGRSQNYQYDAKYNTEQSSSSHIGTNYWYGFSSTIEFYLPNDTGYQDESGYGNQSTTGQDMTFEFSGDDDVWIFVDGELVLDIGGMHDIVSGSINFSTGVVKNPGSQTEISLKAGNHTLTIYYMERGASQANCMIYFNIAPQYSMTLTKEDLSSYELLNGAEFTVYTDNACTSEANLWASRDAYNDNEKSTSVFKVVNGTASLWGFSAGNTYYIKETKAPDGGYSLPKGLIKLSFTTTGSSSYDVLEMVTDAEGNEPSAGFTAYGFRIDPVTEQAYLIITNAIDPSTVTHVSVEKVWDGGSNHPDVTVSLLADGNQIQSIVLNPENDWKHRWENLPKYRSDGITEIQYTVEESAVVGYVGQVETLEHTDTETGAITGYTFRITNTLVKSLKVTKVWDMGNWITDEKYRDLSVSVKLLADGSDTGKTVTLTRDNRWTDSFTELPVKDDEGNDIVYSVEEDLIGDEWRVEYGEITASEGSETEFETTITNVYVNVYTLPKTGGPGIGLYTASGIALTTLALFLMVNRRKG